MKKILAGLAATILMTVGAYADEVAVGVAGTQMGIMSWVVIDDDIYKCHTDYIDSTEVVCVKAKKRNSD